MMHTIKQSFPIDHLLQWAYLHELPKRRISSAEGIWDRLAQYGSLGGINPDPSPGGAQRYAQFGLPHPDAERIERAVEALQPVQTDWESYFGLLCHELAPLVTVNDLSSGWPTPAARARAADLVRPPDGRGVSVHAPRDVLLVQTIPVSVLVHTHAIKGTRPNGWRTSEMRPIQTRAERGPLAKIIGVCKGKNSYSSGSYCPLQWQPSPIGLVLARANYFAWWQGLAKLALEIQLAEYTPLPPSVSPAPWINEEAPGNIFAYPPLRDRPLPLKPTRKLAGPPEQRKRDKGRKVAVMTTMRPA